jgi:hypothetical protein
MVVFLVFEKISEPNSSVVLTSTEASSSTVISMLSRLDEGDAMKKKIKQERKNLPSHIVRKKLPTYNDLNLEKNTTV